MAIRIAIFIIFILLGFLALYWFTRDKWAWGENAKPVLGLIAALLILPLAMTFYMVNENKAQTLTEFDSIPLGATTADLKFIKGAPDSINNKTWSYVDKKNKFNTTLVSFSDTYKVSEVRYEGRCEFCKRISGFGIGSNYEETLEKFGEPSSTSFSEDGLEQRVEFSSYNTFFIFEKGKALSFGIFANPQKQERIIENKNTSIKAPSSTENLDKKTTQSSSKTGTPIKIRKDLSSPYQPKPRN